MLKEYDDDDDDKEWKIIFEKHHLPLLLPLDNNLLLSPHCSHARESEAFMFIVQFNFYAIRVYLFDVLCKCFHFTVVDDVFFFIIVCFGSTNYSMVHSALDYFYK